MALEEADKILLNTLAEIGFEDESITILDDLNPAQVFEAVALCIRQVRPEMCETVSRKMPVSLTARLNMCNAMAEFCKELGFRGDLGYQTFLYGSTKEIRNIIVFLADKFPKQEIAVADSQIDPRTAVLRGMRSLLTEALRQPWTPHYCRPARHDAPFRTEPISAGAGTFVTLQPDSSDAVVPSVLDWTARLAVGGPAPVSVAPLPQSARLEVQQAERLFPPLETPQAAAVAESPAAPAAPDASAAPAAAAADSRLQEAPPDRTQQQEQRDREQELQQRREQELADANARLEQSQRKLAKGSERCSRLVDQCRQLEAESAALSAALGPRRAALALRRRARAALDAGGDAAAGAAAVSRARQRADGRRAEWTARRAELERALAELRRSARAAPLQELADRQRQLRQELAQRERALVTLRQQAAGLGKHVKRTAYTKRILEIVGSVKKQRQVISATIEETKALRKKINSTTDKISRTFQMAEELIFKEAASSEWSRASYRGLVSLHDSCSELVSLVEQTAAVMRHGRRLQEMIEVERSRHVERSLEQVRSDLEQVRLENERLRAA